MPVCACVCVRMRACVCIRVHVCVCVHICATACQCTCACAWAGMTACAPTPTCSWSALITPSAVPYPDVARLPVLQCVSTRSFLAPVLGGCVADDGLRACTSVISAAAPSAPMACKGEGGRASMGQACVCEGGYLCVHAGGCGQACQRAMQGVASEHTLCVGSCP